MSLRQLAGAVACARDNSDERHLAAGQTVRLAQFQEPQYQAAFATYVNNKDQVVGYAGYPIHLSNPIPTIGFLYDQGVVTTINFPNATNTTLTGIDFGVITGYSAIPTGYTSFLYDNGTFNRLHSSGGEQHGGSGDHKPGG